MVMTKSQSFREFSFGMDRSWYSKVVDFMLMTKSQIFSGVLRWNGSLVLWQGCGWEFLLERITYGMTSLWFFVSIRFDLSCFQWLGVLVGMDHFRVVLATGCFCFSTVFRFLCEGL
jgi:hypothetical protein